MNSVLWNLYVTSRSKTKFFHVFRNILSHFSSLIFSNKTIVELTDNLAETFWQLSKAFQWLSETFHKLSETHRELSKPFNSFPKNFLLLTLLFLGTHFKVKPDPHQSSVFADLTVIFKKKL